MSRKIIESKLVALRVVLHDLRPHITESRPAQEAAHYEIERQVQLVVELCVAIGRRVLTLRGLPVPETDRQVFAALYDAKLLSRALAAKLARAAALRNLLVHEYEGIDYDIFFAGLTDGYRAFVAFAKWASEVSLK